MSVFKESVLTKNQWIAYFAMIVGMFMAVLDIQIVASSLPHIQAGLSATLEEISWVQTAYLIAEVIIIPMTGFLSRLLSTRILFTVAAVGFTISSALCAIAWNIESMIIFRAIQGFIGGAMIPTVFATTFSLFNLKQQAQLTVVIGLVVTVAPTFGPIIGGFLTEYFSWHWMFLVNLFPGVIISFLVYKFGHFDKPNHNLIKGFDFIGVIFMAIFLASTEYVLEEGSKKDWFSDAQIVLFSLTGFICFVIFLFRVSNYHNPIVDVKAFKNKNFSLGCVFSFTLGLGLYGLVYLIPVFLGYVRNLTSLQIGFTMMITGMAQMLSGPIAGTMFGKKPMPRSMLAFGLLFFAFGTYINSFKNAHHDYVELVLPQLIVGMSLMFCFIPINTMALGTLPKDQIKNASGLYNLMRNLGGALGLAILNTILNDRIRYHTLVLKENINLGRSSVFQFMNNTTNFLYDKVSDPGKASLKLISNIISREAFIMALNDCFVFIAIMFIISLPLVLFIDKVDMSEPALANEAH